MFSATADLIVKKIATNYPTFINILPGKALEIEHKSIKIISESYLHKNNFIHKSYKHGGAL
jgi:hypothetical protein